MKRVKKQKKPISDRPTKTPLMYVTQTNYVNLAIMVRTLRIEEKEKICTSAKTVEKRGICSDGVRQRRHCTEQVCR